MPQGAKIKYRIYLVSSSGAVTPISPFLVGTTGGLAYSPTPVGSLITVKDRTATRKIANTFFSSLASGDYTVKVVAVSCPTGAVGEYSVTEANLAKSSFNFCTQASNQNYVYKATSLGSVTIADAVTPSITLTNPIVGDQWMAGTSHTIKWYANFRRGLNNTGLSQYTNLHLIPPTGTRLDPKDHGANILFSPVSLTLFMSGTGAALAPVAIGAAVAVAGLGITTAESILPGSSFVVSMLGLNGFFDDLFGGSAPAVIPAKIYIAQNGDFTNVTPLKATSVEASKVSVLIPKNLSNGNYKIKIVATIPGQSGTTVATTSGMFQVIDKQPTIITGVSTDNYNHIEISGSGFAAAGNVLTIKDSLGHVMATSTVQSSTNLTSDDQTTIDAISTPWSIVSTGTYSFRISNTLSASSISPYFQTMPTYDPTLTPPLAVQIAQPAIAPDPTDTQSVDSGSDITFTLTPPADTSTSILTSADLILTCPVSVHTTPVDYCNNPNGIDGGVMDQSSYTLTFVNTSTSIQTPTVTYRVSNNSNTSAQASYVLVVNPAATAGVVTGTAVSMTPSATTVSSGGTVSFALTSSATTTGATLMVPTCPAGITVTNTDGSGNYCGSWKVLTPSDSSFTFAFNNSSSQPQTVLVAYTTTDGLNPPHPVTISTIITVNPVVAQGVSSITSVNPVSGTSNTFSMVGVNLIGVTIPIYSLNSNHDPINNIVTYTPSNNTGTSLNFTIDNTIVPGTQYGLYLYNRVTQTWGSNGVLFVVSPAGTVVTSITPTTVTIDNGGVVNFRLTTPANTGGILMVPTCPAGVTVTVPDEAGDDCGHFVTLSSASTASLTFNNSTSQAQNVTVSYTTSDGMTPPHTATASAIVTVNPSVVSSYTITTSANPLASGTIAPPAGAINGDGTAIPGGSVTLHATANSNYVFLNWTEGGTVVSSSSYYMFTITGNRTLVANFSPQPVINSFQAASSTIADGSATQLSWNVSASSCSLKSSANANELFSGGAVGSISTGALIAGGYAYTLTCTGDVGTTPATKTINISVYVPTITYSISASANNASYGTVNLINGASYSPLTGSITGLHAASMVSLMALANPGYQFINWTENGTQVSVNAADYFSISSNPSRNRTLVANFGANIAQHVISVQTTTGGTVLGGGTYQELTPVTVTATPDSGFTFSNWTEGGVVVSGASASYTFNVPGNDRTLVAHFAQYVAATDFSDLRGAISRANQILGSSVVGSANGNYTQNAHDLLSSAIQTATAVSNAAGSSQSVVNNATNALTQAVVDFQSSVIVVVASGVPTITSVTRGTGTNSNVYTVTGTNLSGSYVSFYTPSLDPVTWYSVSNNTGTSLTFTLNTSSILPGVHYNFYVVPPSGAWSAVYDFVVSTTNSLAVSCLGNVTGGNSNTVAWQANASGGSGSYSFSWSVYNDVSSYIGNTSSAAFSAVYTTAGAKQVIVRVNDGTSQVSAGCSTTIVSAPHTISISATPSAGGTVTFLSGSNSVADGSLVNVGATANPNYSFSGWTDNNGALIPPNALYSYTIYSVTSDHTLVAHFAPNVVSHTITLSANPTNGGTVSGGGTVADGSVTVTATPASSSFSFTNWVDTATHMPVSTSASYTYTSSADRSLVANFQVSNVVPGVPTITSVTRGTGANSNTFSVTGTNLSGTQVAIYAYDLSTGWAMNTVVTDSTHLTFTISSSIVPGTQYKLYIAPASGAWSDPWTFVVSPTNSASVWDALKSLFGF